MEIHVTATEVLALVALAIMIAPTIAGWVRMPGLIGLVLAGTLIGPYVLGWLPEGSVDSLGGIGLLYLMFQAGLEIDMATFKKYRSSAIIFGLLTFAFPFVAGALEGYYILDFPIVSAILIGSIWASHTLVTLPEIREAGLGSSPAVTTAASGTIITDTLALVILAVVTAEGDSPAAILTSVVIGLVALAVYCFVVLPWTGKRFFRRTGQSRALRFAFLLFALASAGVLSEFFGIEGLVGAFLAGLGVNRLVPHGGPLMERVDFFGNALFVPAFLIYVGTKLDPAVIIQPVTIVMAALFMGALVVGKGLAAFLGGRILKFSFQESGLIFGMTVPQAAATLAATLVGAEVGLLSNQVVNAVVFVVLTSIILGTLVTKRFAALVEMPSGATRPIGSAVIVGLPVTEMVAPLVRIASAVARGSDGLLMPIAVASTEGLDTDEAERVAKEADRTAEAHGSDAETRVRYAESYSKGMLEALIDRRASAIVTPLAARGRYGRLFGNETERIGRESSVPVIAVRAAAGEPTKVILGLDAKAASAADRYDCQIAADVARALAADFDVPLAVSARDDAQAREFGAGEAAEQVFGPHALTENPQIMVPGAILVVPASLVRRVGPAATAFADRFPDATMVIVAGPYRLRTTFGSAPAANYLGAVPMAEAPVDPRAS